MQSSLYPFYPFPYEPLPIALILRTNSGGFFLIKERKKKRGEMREGFILTGGLRRAFSHLLSVFIQGIVA